MVGIPPIGGRIFLVTSINTWAEFSGAVVTGIPNVQREIFRIRFKVRVYVPYFWPYELWGYSLKFRPYFSALYMVGTSNQSVPEMDIEMLALPIPTFVVFCLLLGAWLIHVNPVPPRPPVLSA